MYSAFPLFLQYVLKGAASDLFKGKKENYPASVARPYLTTHLGKSTIASHNSCSTVYSSGSDNT